MVTPSEPRLNKLRRLLRRFKCNYILVSDVNDARYISGFHSSSLSLLVSKRVAFLCTDFRYRENAQNFCSRFAEWTFMEIKENSFSYLNTILQRGQRLGIQSNVITLDQHDALAENCPGVTLINLQKSVSELGMVKQPQEITAMKKAARIGDRAFKKILQFLKPGRTEKEVALMLEQLCRRYGSWKSPFEPIVLFGERSSLPHGEPSERRLRKGDFVLMDFGCTVDGFCSDMSRTIVVGKASPKQRKIYSIVRQAQKRARLSVRPGMLCRDIDAAARSYIETAGFSNEFGHATGHGPGLRVHESPRIAKAESAIVTEGMVFTIEPGIYIPKFGGVRIEDMVLVTPDKTETLTRSPRHLIELQI